MFASIFVTLVIVASLGHGLRSERDVLISHRPYNNRHNDASGARDHHFV
jgi:hypothetical protein